MKIGLVADTQGSFDIDAFVGHVATAFRDVDEIWHAGDWGSPLVLDGLQRIGKPLVVVNGNAPDDPRYPMTVEGMIGKRRVLMVHNLDLFLPRLRGRAGEGPFDLIIHGHTHRWRDEIVGATRFINPGTATRPQFGGTERTMALINFGADLLVEKLLVPTFSRTAREAPRRTGRGPI